MRRHNRLGSNDERTMRADILKLLLETHANNDDKGFRKAALQLADAESLSGHIRVADDLRRLIAEQLPTSTSARGGLVDIAQPRGELADLLEGGYRDERFSDIVLNDENSALLHKLIREIRVRHDLAKWGVEPNRRLMFCGPPGSGKTLAAKVLAGELGLPLMTVRFDALFSRYLGETATHLRAIFSEMPRRPAVYFFDEFDAVGKSRGDAHDVGEVRRVVTSFLQLLDADTSDSPIIAATNYEEIIDRAAARRFDLVLRFGRPTRAQLVRLISIRLQGLGGSQRGIDKAATLSVKSSLSFADAARSCDDAIRNMVLGSRNKLQAKDIEEAFQVAASRATAQTDQD